MADYKRQGSIDDENFLYLAESSKESNKDLSDNMNTCLVNLQTSINNGSEKIKDSIDNIDLKCDNSDIVEELKNESIGEKLEDIKNAILNGGSSEEVEDQINELTEKIEDIQDYLDVYTEHRLSTYANPTGSQAFDEDHLEILEWLVDYNKCQRFGPVVNLRLYFALYFKNIEKEYTYGLINIQDNFRPDAMVIHNCVAYNADKAYPAIIYFYDTGRVEVGILGDISEINDNTLLRITTNLSFISNKLYREA